MWAGDKTASPYVGCCAMLANAEVFSFWEGVSTVFAGSRDVLPTQTSPHLWPNLGGFREGKAFIAAKQSGHGVAVLLPVGTKVSHGLMCCLSQGLQMGFVTCVALFMSLQ